MNWSNISNGYEFKIYFQHGQHSSLVVETLKCPLDNEKEFNKMVEILSHLDEAIIRNFQSHTGKVAQYIEKKTSYSEAEIMQIIEEIIRCDIKFEEYMAQVVYIEIYRYEDGKVQKAYLEFN